jgi:hypothetical protein
VYDRPADQEAANVVGTCAIAGESQAFVWTAEAGMQDLNDFIPSDAGVVLVGAHAINNKGQLKFLDTTHRRSTMAWQAARVPPRRCS